jgi:hypothetical protein
MIVFIFSLALSNGYAASEAPSTCSLLDHTNHKSRTQGWYKIQGERVNLRGSPSFDGSIVSHMPTGTDVYIGECVDKKSLGTSDGCWHPILTLRLEGHTKNPESAFLFSTDLADCFLSVDLDQDGVDEEVYLTEHAEGYQIRVRDPNGKRSLVWMDIKNEEAYTASITTISAKQSGVPLLSVHLPVESCGETSLKNYYRYVNKPEQMLHNVISERSFSDSPAYSDQTVVWNSDKTLTYKVDTTSYSSTQKYCLNDVRYEACGHKTEQLKE